jgi:hypothetical protein
MVALFSISKPDIFVLIGMHGSPDIQTWRNLENNALSSLYNLSFLIQGHDSEIIWFRQKKKAKLVMK